MQIDVTPTSDVTETASPVASGVSPHEDGFGTRPRTDRPHSISLFGAERSSSRDGASRGLDVLLGVGIGAAVMYYFDPERGPRRRASIRDRIALLMRGVKRGREAR